MMIKLFRNIAAICLVIAMSSCFIAGANTYSVKDFGAAGNGIKDDFDAFQQCFKAAAKQPQSVILIPFGTYVISDNIILDHVAGQIEIKGVLKGTEQPVLLQKSFKSGIVISGLRNGKTAKGSIKISNLKIQGQRIPYSPSHPYINTARHIYGISITDAYTATITNVTISDIYGRGINIFDSQTATLDDNERFENVVVENNKILNCWGYNPERDDYGDGIYIACVKKASIKNNQVINDIRIVKELGRGGIVLEEKSQDCVVQNNTIEGYDRAIHIENDYGGHYISGNRIQGSDLGLLSYNLKKAGPAYRNKPTAIVNNFFSNKNLYKGIKVNHNRKENDTASRSLIWLTDLDNCRAGSTVTGNTFVIDGQYDYRSNAVGIVKSEGYTFSGNSFLKQNVKGIKHRIGFYNYSKNSFSKEKFDGVILHTVEAQKQTASDKKNQFLNGAAVAPLSAQ